MAMAAASALRALLMRNRVARVFLKARRPYSASTRAALCITANSLKAVVRTFLTLAPLMIWAQVAAWAGSIEIKVGLLRSVQNAGVFVAQEKGYFAVEGLQAKLVFFNGAQQIPLSVVSHQL